MLKKLMNSYAKRVALPPGTLVHLGEQMPDAPVLSLIVYDGDTCAKYEPASFEDALQHFRPDAVSWLNITGLHDTTLLERVGRKFDIHALTLEDVLNTGARPKAEILPEYVFFLLKMIRYDDVSHGLDIEQISLILGKDFVITFQERPGDVLDTLRDRITQGKGRVRKRGADFLFYAIIDVIVDHYFLCLESVGNDIETLETQILENPAAGLTAELHRIKRELLFLRKVTWPMREQLASLLREENPFITGDSAPYLRDLYDHIIQVIDTVETFRDMLAGLLDVYLSAISNRMNDVMKVLTIIATIFIPLTFIAGVYGMNFEYMPELRQPLAYPIVLGLFAFVAGGMVIFFKRKGWL